MKTIDKKFNEQDLKEKFGEEYMSYAKNDRFYNINGVYILLEKINENQFKIHPAYIDSYERNKNERK